MYDKSRHWGVRGGLVSPPGGVGGEQPRAGRDAGNGGYCRGARPASPGPYREMATAIILFLKAAMSNLVFSLQMRGRSLSAAFKEASILDRILTHCMLSLLS